MAETMRMIFEYLTGTISFVQLADGLLDHVVDEETDKDHASLAMLAYMPVALHTDGYLEIEETNARLAMLVNFTQSFNCQFIYRISITE